MAFYKTVLIFFPILAVITLWITSHFVFPSFYGFIGPYETHGEARNGMISFNANYEGGFFFMIHPVIAPYDSPEEFFAISKPTMLQSIVGTSPDFFITFRRFFPNRFVLSLPTWFIAFLFVTGAFLVFRARLLPPHRTRQSSQGDSCGVFEEF